MNVRGNFFKLIEAQAVGKLKDEGQRVRGEVRVRFFRNPETECDTHARPASSAAVSASERQRPNPLEAPGDYLWG